MRDRKNQRGSLTIYVALIMSVILPLYFLLLEEVRRKTMVLESTCVAEVAMNSILGEYHQKLYQRYDILAIDSSYGEKDCGVHRVEEHLTHYLEGNLEHNWEEYGFWTKYLYQDVLRLELSEAEITGVQCLTDGNGAAFRDAVTKGFQGQLGLYTAEAFLEAVEFINVTEKEGVDLYQEREELKEMIMQEAEPVGEAALENILQWNHRSTIGLSNVLRFKTPPSEKEIDSRNLIYSRMKKNQVNQGNLPYEEGNLLLFYEYLMQSFGSFENPEKSQGALEYELEYILFGKEKDAANLNSSLLRICLLREAANYTHLLTSEEKQLRANGATAMIVALLKCPAIKELVYQLILIVWSMAESMYDMQQLVNGQAVPLFKTSVNWHFKMIDPMETIMSVFREEECTEGLTYRDYLRIFLYLGDIQDTTGRAMNLVEHSIRTQDGQPDFRLDGCFVELQGEMVLQGCYGFETRLKRRISYD